DEPVDAAPALRELNDQVGAARDRPRNPVAGVERFHGFGNASRRDVLEVLHGPTSWSAHYYTRYSLGGRLFLVLRCLQGSHLSGSKASPSTRTSKWRWGPVERPVEPERAITSPARTRWP